MFAITAVSVEVGFRPAASAHTVVLDPPHSLFLNAVNKVTYVSRGLRAAGVSGLSSCWLFPLPHHLAACWPPGAVQEINGTGSLARGLQQGAGSQA